MQVLTTSLSHYIQTLVKVPPSMSNYVDYQLPFLLSAIPYSLLVTLNISLFFVQRAMNQLHQVKRSNVLYNYNIAKGLGNMRPDGYDSVFPSTRMPMGLLEYMAYSVCMLYYDLLKKRCLMCCVSDLPEVREQKCSPVSSGHNLSVLCVHKLRPIAHGGVFNCSNNVSHTVDLLPREKSFEEAEAPIRAKLGVPHNQKGVCNVCMWSLYALLVPHPVITMP